MTKILIVEDEEGARAAIKKIMENYGYTVVDATDCPDALEKFDSHGDVDIVFTDLSLPGLSGWDVAKAVKERNPAVPVVILSGWDIDNEKEAIRTSGVSRILPKPVMIKELIQAVKDFTSKG